MQTLVIELHSTIKKPNNQTKQSNPTIYDTNSNQIPKNPTPTPSGACPSNPTNAIKAEGKSAFPLSPRDTRPKRDLRLSGGSRKCGK
jgi:hypothetical protein